VTDELPVHVSRQKLHSLDVPATFEAHDSFDVVLVNHGQPVHVHLHLDDDLSKVASLDASNHYVDGESRRAVRIHVDRDALPEESMLGKLKVASGYGATTRWIDVELSSPVANESEVEVDESLTKPPARGADDTESTFFGGPELPVLGLGVLALAVAVVAAVVLDHTLVLLGALAVLAGVLVALSLLVRG